MTQERAVQKEAEHSRALERQRQREVRAQQLLQQQEMAEARAAELQLRQEELAVAARMKREEEDRQRQQMQAWIAERAAAAAAAAAEAEARERQEMERLKEERITIQEKMQQIIDLDQHRAEIRQQTQQQQAMRIDDLRAAARAAAAEKAAARVILAAALVRSCLGRRYSRARPAAVCLSKAVAAAVNCRAHACRLRCAAVALSAIKRHAHRACYILLLISNWNAGRPKAVLPATNASFLGAIPLNFIVSSHLTLISHIYPL